MTAVVLLYTMRCNIECGHCSVGSHPGRREKMELADALELVQGLAAEPEIEFIDVSGGEPMLYRRELLELARAARQAGKSLRIVSNGYWATTREKATAVLTEVQAAGVSSVALSIDMWHLAHLNPVRVRNYIAGCRAIGMQPFLSGVLPAAPSLSMEDPLPVALLALLERYGLTRRDVLDVYTWAQRRNDLRDAQRSLFDQLCAEQIVLVAWQPLTGEGRAIHLDVATRAFADTEPEPCGAAGELPTVDEAGRLFPCCAPWISRKEHAIDTVQGLTVGAALGRLRQDPLVRVIHEYGPQVLIEELRSRGMSFPDRHSGICNQCGMLLDSVSLDRLRETAQELLAEKGGDGPHL